MTDHRQSVLWGHVWGDVLGAPVEAWTPSQIRQVFGKYQTLPDFLPPLKEVERIRGSGGAAFRRPLGLHTDDTQQALALLCIARQGGTIEDWGKWVVRGFEPDATSKAIAWRGIGGMFTAAGQRLAQGISVFESGSPSAGIGATMRVGPLAMVPDLDPSFVLLTSLATHRDLRAAISAGLVYTTIKAILEGSAPGDALTQAVNFHTEVSLDFDWGDLDKTGAYDLLSVTSLITQDCKQNDPVGILRSILKHSKPYLQRDQIGKTFSPDSPNHPFVFLGGLTGLLLPVMCPDLPPQFLLSTIIRAGGDTDTVAAIAGGVLGAIHGDDWIPKEKILDHQRIAQYASGGVETIDVFMAMESAHTATERDFQNVGSKAKRTHNKRSS